MTDVRVVLVTTPNEGTARGMCRVLLEERIVACGNVIPGVTSLYRWEGELHEDAEVLVILKAPAARIPLLIERVAELHPYEVPEILSLKVEAGFPPYLAWVLAEGASSGASGSGADPAGFDEGPDGPVTDDVPRHG